MNVTLTPQLEALIEERLKTGFYQDASEVVREGLRFLFAQESRLPRPAYAVSTRAELESKLLEGIGSLDGGKRIPGETALRELSLRADARRRHG